jgi:hypothetical protein
VTASVAGVLWWAVVASPAAPGGAAQASTAPAAATQPAAAPAATAPESLVLRGVPRIGYNIRICPFPGSLTAVLQYLKHPADYDYIMAVSGAAFRRIWSRDDGGNVDLGYLAPEPYERTFLALGYRWRTAPLESRDGMLSLIRSSLAAGRPVIAFGIIGPPEAGIVAGNEQNGDVLLGYSYFADAARGYYRRADWYAQIDKGMHAASTAIIDVGERTTAPPERETLISTLRWAIDLANTPKRPNLPNHICGLAGYDAWATAMEIDADYPANDRKTMDTRVMILGDQCAMLIDRGSAAKYLRSMLKIAPEAAEDLSTAADLYEQIAATPNLYPADPPRALVRAEIRQEIAEKIRIARTQETQAVEYLEKALAKLAPTATTQP